MNLVSSRLDTRVRAQMCARLRAHLCASSVLEQMPRCYLLMHMKPSAVRTVLEVCKRTPPLRAELAGVLGFDVERFDKLPITLTQPWRTAPRTRSVRACSR